ncbi:MarR family winged helix-turn-helix transcriptional regulator [Acinetobacter lwoffii]|jgi:DNA-binding MarR family transcriptional regulator|uniref:DNA-binding MarR family transcriptional regulator n=1 Tax=Acinetobacter lwoffii TaxID=28090 RepID=A0AAW8LQQ7_ACILW|nr:MarR family transcriptional regulator [Acinetobacter lwoffii]MDR6631227.1 DNA-binding MarR family transcriptional regulator [Acinetobacter lwoffii]
MYEQLKLDNQLCFPLYSLSKEITNQYRPFLEAIDLTYPQYLVMMVLWEKDSLSVNEIGQRLHLDSGTLTPLLKRLEQKQLLKRERASDDERRVTITLTDTGNALQQQAKDIPAKMAERMVMSKEEATVLRNVVKRLTSNH